MPITQKSHFTFLPRPYAHAVHSLPLSASAENSIFFYCQFCPG